MSRFIQSISTLLAIAVLGAGFLASTHTHQHSQETIEATVAACSCVGHGQESDSPAPFVPCDHDDCQLCKFMNSFGLVSVPPLDLQAQNSFQFLSADQTALVKLSVAAAYLGRAPPTV